MTDRILEQNREQTDMMDEIKSHSLKSHTRTHTSVQAHVAPKHTVVQLGFKKDRGRGLNSPVVSPIVGKTVALLLKTKNTGVFS